jgi:hypothetical protein
MTALADAVTRDTRERCCPLSLLRVARAAARLVSVSGRRMRRRADASWPPPVSKERRWPPSSVCGGASCVRPGSESGPAHARRRPVHWGGRRETWWLPPRLVAPAAGRHAQGSALRGLRAGPLAPGRVLISGAAAEARPPAQPERAEHHRPARPQPLSLLVSDLAAGERLRNGRGDGQPALAGTLHGVPHLEITDASQF